MLKFVLIAGLFMFVVGSIAYIASFFLDKFYKKKMNEMSKNK